MSVLTTLPAQARLVTITVYPPPDNGSAAPYNWPDKNTPDSVDYWVNAAEVMIDAGATIIQAAADVVTGDDALVITDVAWSPYYIRLIVSNGSPFTPYVISVTAIRSDGLSQSWQVGLETTNLATVQYPNEGTILTLNGMPMSIGSYLISDGTPISAGTPLFSLQSPTSLQLTANGDGGGTRSYTYTFYRALDRYGTPGAYTSIGVAANSTFSVTDSTVVPGNTYWYYYTIVDSTPGPFTSDFSGSFPAPLVAQSLPVAISIPVPANTSAC